MAAGNRSSPRTVADATRFTSNTPHAHTKSNNTPPASASGASGRSSNNSPNASSSIGRRPGAGAGAGGAAAMQETMEERVRRLRAAHLAAKQHSVSRMDQLIGNSRRIFDAAHKFTVMGLIGFSGIALLVTAYATVDMMMLNRKRRTEFFALQKQLKEDSLEAARLAYMTGTATEEQIALVEDATAKANEAGISLPSILSAPQSAAPAGGRDATPSATYTNSEENASGEEKKGGIAGWLFGGLKKEDVRDDETLSTSDDRWRTTAAAAGDVGSALRDKAKAAFESERDTQRRGGPLDQIGLDTTAATSSSGEGKKKGWLW
ncbi:hypothetical protein F5B22DRAFT_648749 [Xylaria bambusicola]|uniref:uncharacterized protein n=1 Tax=Xylaria bambusicola TaxID=326684 RepID=UPI00200862BD|nr:uncharacterized protein F5B22DRAFT_648749 [Xylaria bambusicola]KAI0509728.1 hypothetical protein F5B22DRAFT_648749 [Xylaria bambusicola]